MREDLKKRGRRFESVSVSGKVFERENEYVKIIPQYIKQMQSLLNDMKINPDTIILEGSSDDEL